MKTLNYKKTASITAIVLLLMFCIFVILYERHIRNEAQAYIEKHGRVIANALWNFNPQGASEYLSLACKSQRYEHVVVTDINGEIFITAAGESMNRSETILKTLHLIPVERLASNIVYKEKNIGRIEAVWYCTTIYTELSVLFILILIFLILQLYTRLLDSNQLLEERVLNRTSELSSLNESLQLEIEKNQELSQFRESIIENANIWLNVLDESGRVVVWNKAAESISSYTKEEVVGHDQVWEWLYPEQGYREEILSTVMAIIEKNEVLQDFETTIQRKDGEKRIISWHSRNLKDDKAKPIGSIALGRDITKHTQAEIALKESEDKYKELVQHAPTGIYEFDMEKLKFISVNDVMCEYAGYSKDEFLALDPFELLDEDSQKKLTRLIEDVFTQKPDQLSEEYKMVGKNQEKIWVLVNSKFFYEDDIPKRAMAVVHDLTDIRQAEEERRRLELQLQQAHKMEAIGTLAGGIAHDFNNILAGIMGYCSLLQNNIDNPEKVKDQTGQIFKAATRAAELVSQILAFSRNIDYEKSAQSMSPIIKEVIKLLRSSIPVTIEIQENIISRSKIFANPVKMHQIIMNICTNAYHAMIDTGGTLSISLIDTKISKSKAENLQISKGKYVELEISDTGHGMDRETLNRIFDPYFTTKEFGKGTGMGLSMVYAIVKEHNGAIKAFSRKGKGSSFKVYLPVTDKGQIAHTPSGGPEPMAKSGNERIMIVDDEISILESTQELLSDFGYRVRGYSDGKKAFEAFKKDPHSIDLVLTDMTMPGMTGDLLAKEMINIRDDLPIILCTGYNEKISEEKALDLGIKKFIQKPFVNQPISEIIREVLDS